MEYITFIVYSLINIILFVFLFRIFRVLSAVLWMGNVEFVRVSKSKMEDSLFNVLAMHMYSQGLKCQVAN